MNRETMSSTHKYIIRCMAALFAIFLVLSCTNTSDNNNADNAVARKIEENKMVEYFTNGKQLHYRKTDCSSFPFFSFVLPLFICNFAAKLRIIIYKDEE